ncbi:MAG: fused MFS/spermidine synthase [Anaerolineales bacterium]|nr:fused MFS/spermidine synthase [Anaerolineales bacterium]
MDAPKTDKFLRSIDPKLFFFSGLFLVSGAAGLVYQIVWERLLGLYFGVTMVSVTLIVSAYMAGLGLGSLVGGHLARKAKAVLVFYGLIEIAIGIFGIFSLPLINGVGQWTAGSPYFLVFWLSFGLLLIPTFLMGMTLPLLSQAFIARVENSGQVIGLLYGINTLGAAFGAFITGYFMVGWLGFSGAARVAVIANLAVGLCALALSRWKPGQIDLFDAKEPSHPPATVSWSYGAILMASFLVGFIGLAYEILWFRILSVLNKSTVYGFPTLLSVFLVGLAVGGTYWGKKADRSKDALGLFWKLELGVAISAALTFLIYWGLIQAEFLRPWLHTAMLDFQRPDATYVISGINVFFSRRIFLFGPLEYLWPIVLVVLPTSLLMGGGLPVLDRIAIESPEVAGRRVGDIHLANILGSVLGALATSFVFFPTLGSELTFKTLVFLSLMFPLFYFGSQLRVQKQLSISLPAVGLIVAVLLLAVSLPGRGQFYQAIFRAVSQETYLHESGDSVLAITHQDNGEEKLWIGGEVNNTFPPDSSYEQRSLICVGAALPKRILVIGVGGGNTLYFLTQMPGVEQIVVVELMEDLAPFIQEHLPLAKIALSDPRVEYIIDDGRRYLNANPDEKFDMIDIDPLRRYTMGHNNLYSAEAMQLYQAHLNEGGVFCAWQDEPHLIPRTIASVFPHVDHFGIVTVASNQPIRYHTGYMQTALESYQLAIQTMIPAETLTKITLDGVFSGFVRDRARILAEEATTPVLRDAQPYLEYYLFYRPVHFSQISDSATRQNFFQRIHD